MRRAIGLVAVLACSGPAPSRDPAPPTETGALGATPVSAIATAETTTVVVPLSLPSQLYVEHDATIYARSPGVVEAILVDLGSRVAPGQTLARLESRDQSIALAQAKERFGNTQQMVERERALKVAGVVTQADSEQVEYEHRAAALGLEKAQRDYDLTRIVAPFAGVVTGRTARIHRLVKSGDSLFRVTSLRPVLAAVHVPENSAAGIAIGAEAEVIDLNGTRAKAKVIRASPVLDAASGTREMILQLAGNEPRLLPGSNVTVRLGSQRRQVVAIPRSAVAQDGYTMVWADDKTTLRAITIGNPIGDDRIEVLSGLAAGEKVLRTAP